MSDSGSGDRVAFSVPATTPTEDFIAQVRDEPGVDSAFTMGRIVGADNHALDDIALRASPHQWHLVQSYAPLAGSVGTPPALPSSASTQSPNQSVEPSLLS